MAIVLQRLLQVNNMALNAEQMAVSIEAAMKARGFEPLAEKGASHQWWLALSEGIINHIITASEVNVGAGGGTYRVE